MVSVLSWANSTLFDGLPYALVTLSFVLTFKYIRFPDVTCAGAFVLGAASAAASTVYYGAPPLLAIAAAAAAGTLGGLLTALLNRSFGLEPLLAGIVSTFALYALTSMILRPTLPYGAAATALSSAAELDRAIAYGNVAWHPYAILVCGLAAVSVKLFLDGLLASEFGLALRALEDDAAGPGVLRGLGIAPGGLRAFALAVGNALVAVAGALISMREGAANVHRGLDILITGLIAFLLGVQLQRWLPDLAERASQRRGLRALRVFVLLRHLRVTTLALLGPVLYFGLIGLSYTIEVPPELTKLLLAIFVALTAGDLNTLVKNFTRHRAPAGPLRAILTPSQPPPLEDEAIVDAKGIWFRYSQGEDATLKGLSFRLRKGECVLLRGPNGSGKSTLLKLLAGHLEGEEAGTIRIGGEDLTGQPEHRRRHCGYVAQDPRMSVVSTLTPFENLALASTSGRRSFLRPATTHPRQTVLWDLLSKFDFAAATAKRAAHALSGGQRQVVSLLSLLAKHTLPSVVFLDEPFNNLDATNLDRCVRAIGALQQQGVAIVLVNHATDVTIHSDRICHLGELRQEPAANARRLTGTEPQHEAQP